MLSCQQLTELVTDYTDGRLSLIQRVQFELHIGMCRHCREYLRQLRATASALGNLRAEPMPEPLRRELLERFRAWKP